jgi:hypothetical protein
MRGGEWRSGTRFVNSLNATLVSILKSAKPIAPITMAMARILPREISTLA